MKTSFRFSVIALFFGLLVTLGLNSSAVSAQQTLGAINGTVTDSSGGVLSKVTVKAKNTDTNLEVSATTKDDGSYQISALPIGKYSISFLRDGFKTEVHSQILLQGGVTTTVNGSLQPAKSRRKSRSRERRS